MEDFAGYLAVITGGGSGMGRELAVQLATAGCHVAMCDVSEGAMAETVRQCQAGMPAATRLSAHIADVGDEPQVLAFRDAVVQEHDTDHIDLLFNNAGIGGGGSFVADDRAEWERTFGVCWWGVYYATRAFLPLLIASPQGHLINTSSVNGFWASVGPGIPHTAYSAAKFAVKGFSEALITDLRVNAPHVKVSVVMPGHIGTGIAENTRRVLGQPEPMAMSAGDVAAVRDRMLRMGAPVGDLNDDQIRQALAQRASDFRENAPTSAAQAASIILTGVREDRWRILVGEDAVKLDAAVRARPEQAYELSFWEEVLAQGVFGALSGAAGRS
jgi:NAD(P)-dependent dehydrogenase (short-subunit alcohol dehydrogenase family)